MGYYTDVSIVAQSSAQAGQSVPVEAHVKSLASYTIYVVPVLKVDESWAGEGSYESIVPGQTKVWYMSFIMPDKSVVLAVEAWCEDGFPWRRDGIAYKNVSLEAPQPTISEFTVSGFSKA